MFHLPTRDHDATARRLRTRDNAGATGASGAQGSAATAGGFDALSSEVGAWLASLPAPVRVHWLVEHAPEIANQLAAAWNDIPTTALLLEQLLVDGHARSLSPVIASELLRLYEYHVRCRATDAPNTTWELPASGLQDLPPATACRIGHV